jgi:ATP-dependent helicase HrpB
MIPLPIDPYIEDIVQRVRAARAAIVTAAPGAGKTTRVPPALTADGPVLLLQPRRVAARAIAARIAEERGWTVGEEVGWHVRFERRFCPTTQLLVATEGVLTARLQQDPLLSDFRTIVLDEFHERSIHADLAIALGRQAWLARDDLRIVVMSATIDAEGAAAFLKGCPVIDVAGRMFPVSVDHAAGQREVDAVVEMLDATPGNVLCFQPGASEIRRTVGELERRLSGDRRDVQIVPLFGSLDPREQDEALRESPRRRVVVATNLAETSVTVPGVTAVVDAGFHKVARHDPGRGVDTLDLERITQDAADQRAGRAGRVAPGMARRLWDVRLRLRAHREPEIHRVDLCGAALDVVAWGGDPRRFEWFDAPREDALATALQLLEQLGLIADGALTAAGRQAIRLPVHPRLARMLIAGGGHGPIARACAIISERSVVPPRTAATSSDLLSALDGWPSMPGHVRRTADEIERIARHLGLGPANLDEGGFRKAILAGYPDRVARRRAPLSREVLLASGIGATVAPESGIVDGEFLVAVDVSVPAATNVAGPIVRIASLVERDWLAATHSEIVHRFEQSSGMVKAVEVHRYGALALAERPAPVLPDVAARLLAEAWMERGPRDEDREWLRRLEFAGRRADVAQLVQQAAVGVRSLAAIRIADCLGSDAIRALERDAPPTLVVPSGRRVKLEYAEDGTVSAAVKLQEVFGLAETPRIGPRHEPVLFVLLAPNGRPVQMTRDLRSFWDRGYPEVRKELRGRYPRHPWPDDPWKAAPTARAMPRRS